jgi:dihydrofolate reductase
MATKKSKPAPSRVRRTRTKESHTPLFRAFLAVTLDGYIADTKGNVDYLDDFNSPETDFAGFMKSVAITVYGRTTFNWAMDHGAFEKGGLSKGRGVVLTHRPIGELPKGIEAYNGDIPALAHRLRQELAGTGKDIWLIGGGLSIDAFHQHGLVDRWELSIIPVLLGDGIPLFPKHSRGLAGLKLTHSRALKDGIVEVHYEPAPMSGRT